MALHPDLPHADDEPPARRSPWRGLRDPNVWVLVGIGALGSWLVRDVVDARFQTERARDLATLGRVTDLVESTHVRGRESGAWLDDALRGVLSGLDPYSAWYDRRHASALQRETTGAYLGLGLVFADGRDPYRVLFPLAGSPAEAAGLRPGDRLVRLAREAMPPEGPTPLAQRLADGRPVEVEFEAANGGTRRATLRPAQVVEPSIHHVRYADEERRIGHVAIQSFTRRTAEEFDEAIASLRERGLDGLVLDLRGNRGGVLETATGVANRFVSDGVLVTIESRRGQESVRANRALASLERLPLVVLVDRDTASASEVLAAALQEHRAAVLVGEPTFGKGTVQTLTNVPAAGGIAKISTALYRTPSGRLIERSLPGAPAIGVQPDVEVAVDPIVHREIRAWLGAWGAPLRYVPDIRAWEERSGRTLLWEPPDDPAMDVALALLAGARPALVAGSAR